MAGVPGRSGRKIDPDAVRRARADDPAKWLKWIDLDPEGPKTPPPPMPPAPWYINEDGEWSKRAIDMWDTLWRSPQATMWQADVAPMLERYLLLCERMWILSEVNPSILTQLAKIEDEYGLTPRSMHNLYWRVKPTENTPQLATVHGLQGVEVKSRTKLTEY